MSDHSRDRSRSERVWDAVREGSRHAIAGMLFALPGFSVLFLIDSTITGYYLIGTMSMVGYLSLLNLGRHVEEEAADDQATDPDSSGAFAVLLVTATVFGIGVRLTIATALAVLAVWASGGVLAGVLAAIAVPIIDMKIAARSWYLSPSALMGALIIWVLVTMSRIGNRIDGLSKRSLIEDTQRFGPI